MLHLILVTNRQTNCIGAAMITSTIRITASEIPDDEIVRVLRSLIEPIRVETGCISCGLYKDLHDPGIIVWVEEWKTQEDLERHLRSRQYKKILAAFDMSVSQPAMQFNTVVETKGMQLIADARGIEI
jgi:quinol monooxygenase YgiN